MSPPNNLFYSITFCGLTPTQTLISLAECAKEAHSALQLNLLYKESNYSIQILRLAQDYRLCFLDIHKPAHRDRRVCAPALIFVGRVAHFNPASREGSTQHDQVLGHPWGGGNKGAKSPELAEGSGYVILSLRRICFFKFISRPGHRARRGSGVEPGKASANKRGDR